FFPAIFGPGRDRPLDDAVVRKGFAELAEEVRERTGDTRAPEDVAEGFLRIAVENMANAIKKISVQRGYDVTEYALVAFGGAGGQHACLVADALGVRTVLLHPLAGVLSAYGMGLADVRALRERSIEVALTERTLPQVAAALDGMADEAAAELREQDITDGQIVVRRRVHLRYEGSDSALEVAFDAVPERMQAEFEAAYRQRFGFLMTGKTLVVAAALVEASGRHYELPPEALDARNEPAAPLAQVRAFMAGVWRETPVYDRERCAAGQRVAGPAILREASGTTVVEPGWEAETSAIGNLVLRRVEAPARREAVGTRCDPVMLEVFNNLFMSIAEQMGFALQNTAHSVNIKERLDFSCAIFDAEGQLIANAPHMPVHLGSMGESVRAVIAGNPEMRPGDVYALNDPYHGGTHLPDITVVTPVFDERSGQVLFYVGSRGHHADVGGRTPGSMPADSRTLAEEGVLLDNFKLVEGGVLREAELCEVLADGRWPVRNPEQNLADLRAQVAANEKGVQVLRQMVAHFGLDTVQAYMRHVQDNAEESVRRAIDVLHDGDFEYEMDDGAKIAVAVRIDRGARSATIDFAGTSAQRENNFNAPLAVCRAAVLYVFRTLVDDDIPMNEGCLKPLHLVVPEGCMLNPGPPAAVVAGNVETSQAITDALYGALGVMAAAQGTMNNTTFGNAEYQYYETVAGGTGAGPDFDGTDAVQSHMTNSRLTDPEVLELRYPVLVEEFAIRRGSGGRGRQHGGDGVRRRLRFREDMELVILANRRRVPPFGLAGGQAGQTGRNWIERADGSVEPMDACDRRAVRAGDRWVLETPGGGGYGEAEDERGECEPAHRVSEPTAS
ncbi:hydantoinase B/oxoprolinase family protein, partial [Acidihalobacter prosperus]